MLLICKKKKDLNTKVTQIESKMPSSSGLAASSALTAVENKIPDVSSLVKKIDYNTKVSEIENKVNDHNHVNTLLLQNLILLQQMLLKQD